MISVLLFLFSCTNKYKTNHYLEDQYHYFDHQISDLKGKINLWNIDTTQYNELFQSSLKLTSSDLHKIGPTPVDFLEDWRNIGAGKIEVYFKIISNERGKEDMIISESISIFLEQMDFEVDKYWLPVGIKGKMNLSEGISQMSNIGWETKMDEGNEMVTEIVLYNDVNFRDSEDFIYHLYKINTNYGISSISGHGRIPLGRLKIKSSGGELSFYENTGSKIDGWKYRNMLEEGGIEIKKKWPKEHEDSGYQFKDLEYSISMVWEEKE